MNQPAVINPNTDAVSIATRVLAKASLLDSRMPVEDETVIAAWAEVFEGQAIWLHEALEAVKDFYREQTRDRIMPADVLTRIAAMPLGSNSSDERIKAWLWTWAQHPFALVIQDKSGVETPRWDDPPAGLDNAAVKSWAVRGNIAWMREHLAELIDGIRAEKPSDRS